MAPMRTLVTGGAGFLGSHLCESLLAKGHEVVCMDNLLTGSRRNIEGLRNHARFSSVEHAAMTMAYHRTHGVDTRIVRIFNSYGPRMRPNDGRAVCTFISQALRGEDLTVFGEGRQTRSFCYVDDLVAGILLLLESDDFTPVN